MGEVTLGKEGVEEAAEIGNRPCSGASEASSAMLLVPEASGYSVWGI